MQIDQQAERFSGRSAVFLDRDGVIVRGVPRDGKPYAPRRVEDFRLLPGARKAVAALRELGYLVVVVTNQPDIGNGFVKPAVIAEMHDIMQRKIPLDGIEMCPHRQTDNCSCRKPKPGMLLAASERLSIDLSRSYMVGDRCSDVIAGKSVGCYTVFIDRGYDACKAEQPNAIVGSLLQAVRHILDRSGRIGEPPVG